MILGLLLNVFFLTACLAGQETLVRVQVLFRHGDRTPLQTYPTDPHKDQLYLETQPGQLTNEGKQRQYELGQWIRSRYNGFLPEKYSYTDIKIISDDMDRCLMSAAANLAGLYPPKGDQVWNPLIPWQPIPIHINLPLLEGSPSNCPAQYKMLREIFNSKLYRSVNMANDDLFAYLTKYSGKTVTNITDTFSIRDTLYIESLLGWELPSWTKSVYDKLKNLSALVFSTFTQTTEIAQLFVGPIFKAIVDSCDNATEKVIYYSAHDTNVVNIINVLVPLYPKFTPEFATATIFELWKKDDLQYIKLYLKRYDKLELLNIQNCGQSCELGKFKRLLEPILISLEQKEKICLF